MTNTLSQIANAIGYEMHPNRGADPDDADAIQADPEWMARSTRAAERVWREQLEPLRCALLDAGFERGTLLESLEGLIHDRDRLVVDWAKAAGNPVPLSEGL